MTDNTKETHGIQTDAHATEHGTASGGARAGRRRFIKGAAGAAPILMTVASRPAWGARNCTPSGQMSGNLSEQGEPCLAQGCSQGFWKNHLYAWPPSILPDDPFNDVFQVQVFSVDKKTRSPVTLLDVLESKKLAKDNVIGGCPGGNKNSVVNLGVQAVAAILNAAAKEVNYPLIEDEVIKNVHSAIVGGQCGTLQTTLDELNNLGGPFCT